MSWADYARGMPAAHHQSRNFVAPEIDNLSASLDAHM